MPELHFRKVAYLSPAYDELFQARNKALRIPLNMELNLQDAMDDQDQHHFGLYFEDDELCATAIMKPLKKKTVQMRQVLVVDTQQNKGYGHQLVAHLEIWAQLQGFKEIILHARKEAIDFYKSMDYSCEGKPYVEVGIEHRNMHKQLGNT